MCVNIKQKLQFAPSVKALWAFSRSSLAIFSLRHVFQFSLPAFQSNTLFFLAWAKLSWLQFPESVKFSCLFALFARRLKKYFSFQSRTLVFWKLSVWSNGENIRSRFINWMEIIFIVRKYSIYSGSLRRCSKSC